MGSSRYACKLRESIRQAANDPERKPVLISGEPGLEERQHRQTGHFGSADRRLLLMSFDASNIGGQGVELFGREGSHALSLLDCLGDGSSEQLLPSVAMSI
ncbi:hypothetical protein [Prochlorococcus sp. MIT 1306]|uniref:hypothetical protein n=1 Tax=Prochlorococcus sp. MIT 1306 TaxID=1799667 RepID=UPI0007B3D876|nr:hypothetical protein [Prochlorococcus sp. MIT 1306]KZR61268.1 hypothetical protein PMIT1306_02049 [Prochlorococcus sp. MIT 1306]